MKTQPATDRRRNEREAFAGRLRDALVERGMSQAELARAAGVSKDAITTYMNHRSLPSGRTLVKIAEVLGLDPDRLLPGRGQPDRTPIWLQRRVSAAFAGVYRPKVIRGGRRLTPRSEPARESAR
jgi:transcriptional regulator with XRE-family HTH domain